MSIIEQKVKDWINVGVVISACVWSVALQAGKIDTIKNEMGNITAAINKLSDRMDKKDAEDTELAKDLAVLQYRIDQIDKNTK